MPPEAVPSHADADDRGSAWRSFLEARQHALRQPLNALGLLCEALHLQSLSAAQAPIVRSMREAVVALESQIDGHFQELAASPPPAQAPWRLRSPTAPVPARSAVAASSGRDAARGRRVVVVDDDAAARVGLVLLLEAWDVQVEALGSVGAVREWLASQPAQAPDLVILDYHLPRPGEGLEALRLMRAAWPDRVLRALLITGDDRAALSNALSDGSLECLIKPVMPAPLLQAMQRQLVPQTPAT